MAMIDEEEDGWRVFELIEEDNESCVTIPSAGWLMSDDQADDGEEDPDWLDQYSAWSTLMIGLTEEEDTCYDEEGEEW